jgi:hypothetical protein
MRRSGQSARSSAVRAWRRDAMRLQIGDNLGVLGSCRGRLFADERDRRLTARHALAHVHMGPAHAQAALSLAVRSSFGASWQ